MMQIFEAMAKRDHEQVVFWSEPSNSYRGIIAIHDTTLGPALGGTRFWNYASDAEAVVDVLRLSQGMTYKAAITGLRVGGGKSVILGDNRIADREEDLPRARPRGGVAQGPLHYRRGRWHVRGRHEVRALGDRLGDGPEGGLW